MEKKKKNPKNQRWKRAMEWTDTEQFLYLEMSKQITFIQLWKGIKVTVEGLNRCLEHHGRYKVKQ